jgi:hypothetical protein
MGNLKRPYLTAEEKNFYMIAKSFIQMIDGARNLENKVTNEVWIEWENRGMITSPMKKNIKLVHTYLKKFCIELEENLSETEMKRLEKQLEKFDYKLIDDYSVQKLLRDIKDNLKYAVIKRERLEPILQDIAAVRCVGCTCNYEKCDLYKMLDDISTPFVMEEPNCPYACNLEYYNDEEKKSLEQIKEIVRQRKSVIKEFGRKVEYDDVKVSSRDHRCGNEKHNFKNKQPGFKRRK